MKLIKGLKNFYRLPPAETILGIIKWKLTTITAFIWRRLLIRTRFIAVSGSVGKTTTKEILSDILEQRFPLVRTPGNWNLRKFGGIEATILMARPWHRFAVVEVGIERPGDMQSAARLLKPDIAIMLGVKHCHTNTFKTLDAIAVEKSKLLHNLGRNALAVVNEDDAQVAEMTSQLKCRIIRFGRKKGSDFRLRSATSRWPDRLTLEIEADGSQYSLQTQLVGTHWTPTIMASIATSSLCAVPIGVVLHWISTITPFWARMQPIRLPSSGATILRDDWNGSIDTFEAAFRVLEDAEATRKIVVFSDFSDSRKKLRVRANYLGKMAARLADMAVFVGEYADRSINAAVTEGLDSGAAHGFLSISSTIGFLRSELRTGDLVLIKGQANHHLSRIYLGLIGEVVCNEPVCSKQILCDCCPELGFERQPEIAAFMASPDAHL